MPEKVRNYDVLKADQAVANGNKIRLDALKIRAGLIIHADGPGVLGVNNLIALPNASDLTTAVALANEIKAKYNTHCASACSATTGQGAHMAADGTNTTAAADATDLTSAQTLANEIKADMNAHLGSAVFHPVADATNTIAAADATNQATLETLLNEIKTDLNLHMNMAMQNVATLLVDP